MHNTRSMLMISADAFSALAEGSGEVASLAKKYNADGNNSIADALNTSSLALRELKP